MQNTMTSKLIKTTYGFEVEHQVYNEDSKQWSDPITYTFNTSEEATARAEQLRDESDLDVVLLIKWKKESYEYPDGYVREDGPSFEYEEF